MPRGLWDIVNSHDATVDYRGKSLAQARRTVAEAGGLPDAAVIHVAGTNGKGSTVQFIADVLAEAGHRVGVYSNPIVLPEHHRIRVDGNPITDSEFEARVEEVIGGIDGAYAPTPYEVMTAAGFRHLAHEGVDVAVVEAVTGGRLDVTNVVDADVSVITNVALDHTDEFGNEVERIATRIAGIIDPGSTVVSNVDGHAAYAVEREARVKEADLVTDWDGPAFALRDGLRYDVTYSGETVETDIIGAYQQENIPTAIAALNHVDFDVSPAAVRSALASFGFPGRMEVLDETPLTLLDGAHNPHGVQALCDTLAGVDRDIHAVFGTIDRADEEAMAPIVSDVADHIYVTTPDESASKGNGDPDAAASAAVMTDDPAEVAVIENPVEAFREARDAAAPDGIAVVAGSLYLCRRIRNEFAD